MASKLGEIKIGTETMTKPRAGRTRHGKSTLTGRSDVGTDALEAEYRRIRDQAEVMAQHGPVKVLVRDGKLVQP